MLVLLIWRVILDTLALHMLISALIFLTKKSRKEPFGQISHICCWQKDTMRQPCMSNTSETNTKYFFNKFTLCLSFTRMDLLIGMVYKPSCLIATEQEQFLKMDMKRLCHFNYICIYVYTIFSWPIYFSMHVIKSF